MVKVEAWLWQGGLKYQFTSNKCCFIYLMLNFYFSIPSFSRLFLVVFFLSVAVPATTTVTTTRISVLHFSWHIDLNT